jgi:hypothetical protein
MEDREIFQFYNKQFRNNSERFRCIWNITRDRQEIARLHNENWRLLREAKEIHDSIKKK